MQKHLSFLSRSPSSFSLSDSLPLSPLFLSRVFGPNLAYGSPSTAILAAPVLSPPFADSRSSISLTRRSLLGSRTTLALSLSSRVRLRLSSRCLTYPLQPLSCSRCLCLSLLLACMCACACLSRDRHASLLPKRVFERVTGRMDARERQERQKDKHSRWHISVLAAPSVGLSLRRSSLLSFIHSHSHSPFGLLSLLSLPSLTHSHTLDHLRRRGRRRRRRTPCALPGNRPLTLSETTGGTGISLSPLLLLLPL